MLFGFVVESVFLGCLFGFFCFFFFCSFVFVLVFFFGLRCLVLFFLFFWFGFCLFVFFGGVWYCFFPWFFFFSFVSVWLGACVCRGGLGVYFGFGCHLISSFHIVVNFWEGICLNIVVLIFSGWRLILLCFEITVGEIFLLFAWFLAIDVDWGSSKLYFAGLIVWVWYSNISYIFSEVC